MQRMTTQDLDALDLADPRLWEDGPPYELFATLQRERPIHFSEQAVAPEEGGFWSVVRFEDVHTVTRDFETFSSERRGIFAVDDIGMPLDIQRLQMISMDPPRHDRLKKIVGQGVHAGPRWRSTSTPSGRSSPACSTGLPTANRSTSWPTSPARSQRG